MRVSEYSMGRTLKCHNVRAGAVEVTKDGLAVEFLSDKSSKYSPCVKHRQVPWNWLPKGAKQVFQKYEEIHPKKVLYHFVRIDGRPLTRKNITDWLNMCVLMTDWRRLRIVPHSMRVGRSSSRHLAGESILSVHFDGRWGEKSGAIKAYTQLGLVSMSPEQIFQKKECYHRSWTVQHLDYIAHTLIETRGKVDKHPFARNLKKHFPSSYQNNEAGPSCSVPGHQYSGTTLERPGGPPIRSVPGESRDVQTKVSTCQVPPQYDKQGNAALQIRIHVWKEPSPPPPVYWLQRMIRMV